MTREEAIEILDEIETIDDSMVAYNKAYGEAINILMAGFIAYSGD